jgi:hypothetical protein
MRSQDSIGKALSDIDRGIELFQQSVQGDLAPEERRRLARDALRVRMEFDSLLADLLAELQRRQQASVADGRPSGSRAN